MPDHFLLKNQSMLKGSRVSNTPPIGIAMSHSTAPVISQPVAPTIPPRASPTEKSHNRLALKPDGKLLAFGGISFMVG